MGEGDLWLKTARNAALNAKARTWAIILATCRFVATNVATRLITTQRQI
jgi:hypothetical protein